MDREYIPARHVSDDKGVHTEQIQLSVRANMVCLVSLEGQLGEWIGGQLRLEQREPSWF